MRKKYEEYELEFKVEAMRRVLEGGESLHSVSRDLDVDRRLLRVWMKRVKAAGGDLEAAFGQGAIDEEEVEMRRLRRENARLRQENEFLKKTAEFLKQLEE